MEQQFYVYTLTDPRNGEVFYVGKGQGDRKDQHVYDARRGKIMNRKKHDRIMAILDAKHEVTVEIVEYFDREEDAIEEERIRIEDGRATLTNIMSCGAPTTYTARCAHARRKAKKMFARMMPYHEWVRAKPRTERDKYWALYVYHGVISMVRDPYPAKQTIWLS